ncbi:MAG: sigma-70 family RNA polymerase sigma factor [Syntrophorhabdales bacterium]
MTRTLIRDGKEGDANALSTLFARYQERVLRIVRLRLSAPLRDRLRLQSMDILQETFLHAIRKLKDFEPTTEASFLHWLSRIVENVIRDQIDYSRAGKRDSAAERSLDQSIALQSGHVHLRDLIPDEGTSPTQAVVRKGIRSIVDNLLLELEEPERELIIQRKLEGLTFGEMAAELGKSEDAVRKLFNRSFQKLIALAEKNKVSERLGFG